MGENGDAVDCCGLALKSDRGRCPQRLVLPLFWFELCYVGSIEDRKLEAFDQQTLDS